jgi:two-component system, NtrC family, nitrogen regulation response regulator NtrX
MALDILIVDDEADIRDLISGILQDEGYATRTAANSDEALREFSERRPSLIVLDIWLANSAMDGLELLDEIKRRQPIVPVIIISGHGTVETAVAAIKRGAYDFLEKPFQSDQLILCVQRATETERLKRENEELRERSGLELEFTGSSAAITATRQSIKKVAATGSRVLITGPAGAGKEVAARLLHGWSTRSDGPLVMLAAASLEPDRVEAELFGLEQDGAVVKTGLLEQAHGGTLFLDEVADMPPTTQAKILRVLIDQVFQRVGGTRAVRVDVRVVSATSRDLRTEIAAGRFREDLYHRLNVVPVAIPSLVARREDIPELVSHFAKRLSLARGRRAPGVSEEAIAVLQSYDWPGNVRQLRNIIERTLIMAPEEEAHTISAAMLPPELSAPTSRMLGGEDTTAVMSVPLREAREVFEREYLRVQIRRFSGNISRTAAFIGMERSALHRKMRSLGLTDLDRSLQRGDGDDYLSDVASIQGDQEKVL